MKTEKFTVDVEGKTYDVETIYPSPQKNFIFKNQQPFATLLFEKDSWTAIEKQTTEDISQELINAIGNAITEYSRYNEVGAFDEGELTDEELKEYESKLNF